MLQSRQTYWPSSFLIHNRCSICQAAARLMGAEEFLASLTASEAKSRSNIGWLSLESAGRFFSTAKLLVAIYICWGGGWWWVGWLVFLS